MVRVQVHPLKPWNFSTHLPENNYWMIDETEVSSPFSEINFPKLVVAAFALLLVASTSPSQAVNQTARFKIPPVKIPLNIKEQTITIVASALITVTRKESGSNIIDVTLSADLSSLQQNLTDLLSSELDKDDRCGDRITIQNATLIPVDPASLSTVQLHYERWGCVKVFGKQQSKRLIAGNATIQMKLSPVVDENHRQLRLVPEVGPVEADGSLGELLRSGTLGQMLQDKIRDAILSALQKGTSLDATLPPAIQPYAAIQNARFEDAGRGQLTAVLNGEFQVTNDQIQLLAKQVKALAASR
jgi:hypothetical protein